MNDSSLINDQLTPDQLIAFMEIVAKVVKEKEEMAQQPPETRILQQNSITKLEALIPVRVATSRPLEGNWSGHELDDVRVIGSLFGGPHFILQLGYNQTVGYAASFRLVFVAHMPVEKGVVLTDAKAIEDAMQTARAFMMMLNLRRVPHGTPMAGKRADVLIVDEVSDIPPSKPYVANLDDVLPGKRPV
jgi:hypothetical protein